MLSENKNYFEMLSDDGISDQARALYLQGEELRIKEKYKEALLYYNEALVNEEKYVRAYWGKYYTVIALYGKAPTGEYRREIISCLNCIINYGPIAPTPYYIRSGFYIECGHITNAISTLKKALRIAPKEILLLREIAKCYFVIGDIGRSDYYYRKALSVIPECTTPIIESVLHLFNIPRLHVKQKFSSNFRNRQVTFYEAEIHAELSQMYQELGYLSKAVFEIGYAIKDSVWSEYYLQRSNLFRQIGGKWKVSCWDKYICDLQSYYGMEIGFGGNEHSMLYTLIKRKGNHPETLNLDKLSLLFTDYPLSIVDIFKVGKDIVHLTNEALVECFNSVYPIGDFILLMAYLDAIAAEQNIIGIKAILSYYLGGIASSYILFDEDLDNGENLLSSMEMYYYSKVAKIIGIDFIPIVNDNIRNLMERPRLEQIDLYYLGQMLLLKDDVHNAMKHFEASCDFIFSKIMLSYLKEEHIHIASNQFYDIFNLKRNIDVDSDFDSSQLYGYFNLIECGEAIEYCFPEIEQDEVIYKPLWEVFHISSSGQAIIENRIKWYSLENILRFVCSKIRTDAGEKARMLLGDTENAERIPQAVCRCCNQANITSQDILIVTQYLYASNKISIEDFVGLNLYCIQMKNQKSLSNITKTIVYVFLSSFSLWEKYIGFLMQVLFFVVDNNLKAFQVKDITYEKYVEMLKSELFDNKNFNNIIKRLEKLG